MKFAPRFKRLRFVNESTAAFAFKGGIMSETPTIAKADGRVQIVSFRASGACESPDLASIVEQIYRLRYSTYCIELGISSANANALNQTLRDELDETAHHFVALQNSRVVACVRLNWCRDSKIGIFEELYNLKASPKHPFRTSIATKLIVSREFRGDGLVVRLLGEMTRHILANGIDEVYIDSRISLVDYYKKIGVVECGPGFIHPETGAAIPLKFDSCNLAHLESVSSPLLAYY